MITESEQPYWITLAALLTVCGLIHCCRKPKDDLATNDDFAMEDKRSIPKFKSLQRRYLGAFFLALFSEWLQGPYIYRLYKSYGFSPVRISLLYVVGFAASAVFGIIAGVTADRCGRKRSVLAFCALYATCCFLKVFPDFRILVCAGIFGGMATSMLFSAFESWYVHEHVQRYGLLPEWMSATFATTTFWNSALAIGAGVLSNGAAETLAFGPVAPFLLAIPFVLACMFVTAAFWSENYGTINEHVGYFRSFCDGLTQVLSRRPILLLAMIQSLFESTMHIFVFVWTPILDEQYKKGQPKPIGLVFASFMVCIMIGASIHNVAIHEAALPAQYVLVMALSLGLFSMSLATVATASAVTYLVAFFLFEVAVGLYFPAISYLRSRVVPESHRIAILNWFRLPMNTITCVALIYLPRSDIISQELDVSRVFIICSACLAVAVFAGVCFARSMRHMNKVVDKINI